MEPWGTPETTGSVLEELPPITTDWVLSLRKRKRLHTVYTNKIINTSELINAMSYKSILSKLCNVFTEYLDYLKLRPFF